MKDQDKTQSLNTILDTAIIQTGRMDVMTDFFSRGLDLGEPLATGGDHLGFQLPNAYLGFDQVDDIDASFRTFKAMGAKVKYPPTKKPWGVILTALYDPDGNIFGLAQRGA